VGRVVAYARVSTDKQDAANQTMALDGYMSRNGIDADEVITETVSGTVKLADRKVGSLIASLTDGDTLIVSELSRLSRDMLTIATIIQECLSKSVTIIAVKEGWTLGNDPGSKFTAVAFGMAAEIERNFISQRTKEGLARRRSEGVVLGRPVGTHRPEHRKLFGKDDEMVRLLKADMPLAGIARLYSVTTNTVRSYVNDQKLRAKALGLSDEQSTKSTV
jgi:putative DNA-invertase from lambdoid prophage Rac